MGTRGKLIAAAILAGALAMTPLTAQAREVDPPPADTPEVVETIMPMNVGGYDEDVAAANGFEIVTHADGSQESVPVTDEAKTLIAEADARRDAEVGLRTTVYGDCGSARLFGRKSAGDWVDFSTGYSVYLAVSQRHWTVLASGFVTGFTYNYPSAATAANWTGEGAGQAVGPGVALVPLTANVILTNGAVCYSGGPNFGFP